MSRILSLAAVGLCLTAFGCDGQPPSGSTSTPRNWSQSQGGSGHSGAKLKRTVNAFAEHLKWEVEVGPVAFSSPVIGPDGTVYVGTVNGELVAVHKHGFEKWRTGFFDESKIAATPAVADNGSIYVITSKENEEGDPISTLECVSPDGVWTWTRFTGDFRSFTSAAPTLLGDYVFIFARTSEYGRPELLVFEQNGDIVARAFTDSSGPVCGRTFLSGVWDFITSCVLGCSFDPSGSFGAPMPTVAVARTPELTPQGWPIAIVADHRWISAYEVRLPDLVFLWRKTVFGGGCGDDRVLHSTPAITPDGQVVIGNENGKIRSLDLLTGRKLWTVEVNGPTLTTPASFGRQVYVASSRELHRFDFDGELLTTVNLPARTQAAPVISLNHVHIATAGGLQTYDLDLDGDEILDSDAAHSAASPAIGEDGTLYVVTADGRLRAYGGDPVPPNNGLAPPSDVLDPGTGGEPTEPPGPFPPGFPGGLVFGGGSSVLAPPENPSGGGPIVN